MREDEWLAATNPHAMVWLLRDLQASKRKLRLFAVFCSRQILHLVRNDDLRYLRAAVTVAEKFADAPIAMERVEAIGAVCDSLPLPQGDPLNPEIAATCALKELPLGSLYDNPADTILDTLGFIHAALAGSSEELTNESWRLAKKAEEQAESLVLRHIFGNPFRPPPPLPHVPAVVRDLAEAVYQQEPAAVGPLHDALLDAGLTELADHFQDTAEWHPKGCWCVDLLTGRL